jgi:hypothetical protein
MTQLVVSAAGNHVVEMLISDASAVVWIAHQLAHDPNRNNLITSKPRLIVKQLN